MSAGFVRALRAEWTKFRTVRGWVLGTLAAALLVPLLGVIGASASSASCDKAGVEVACPEPPLGPDGRAVRDEFFFVHRTLDGDGSITVRLASMSGLITYPPPDHDRIVPGLVPWAKAGVIVKDGTEPGSSYAAVMVTGEHGVRMQHDYTGDVAGRPGGAPRWLRLVRAGPLLTGYESADGQEWAEVGTARLPGLPERVEIGLFAASPGDLTVKQSDLAGSSSRPASPRPPRGSSRWRSRGRRRASGGTPTWGPLLGSRPARSITLVTPRSRRAASR